MTASHPTSTAPKHDAPFRLLLAWAALLAVGVLATLLAGQVLSWLGTEHGWGFAAALGPAVSAMGMVSLLPVGLLGPRGLMPAVWGYFAGGGLRLAACLGAGWWAVGHWHWPGRPVAIVLAVVYLPLLLAEAALVGRYLWQKDQGAALKRPAMHSDDHRSRPGAHGEAAL